jgi:hypothetical protein
MHNNLVAYLALAKKMAEQYVEYWLPEYAPCSPIPMRSVTMMLIIGLIAKC